MKIDILIFGAHPDDVELGCGGTVIKLIAQGKKVAIIDLTKGELGTRGTAQTRKDECENATKILGIEMRENMDFKDGFFENDEGHKLALIKKIRNYQPEIVIANAPSDRHPDHGRASQIVVDACFLSGLHSYAAGDPIPIPSFVYYLMGIMVFSAILAKLNFKSAENEN